MLSIAVKVLSILGILLLCLLGLVVLSVLLMLFFPISYRLTGKKDAEEMSVRVRVLWLFGFLRVLYEYPEPGKILVKVLPFTVFDSGKRSGADGKSKETSGGSGEKTDRVDGTKEGSREKKKEESDSRADSGQESQASTGMDQTAAREEDPEAREENPEVREKNPEAQGTSQEETENSDPLIFKKFKKIKYTICSIYDKIKNIWENISYYIELLHEEETRQLFSHVIFRLGKILKNVRPRCIRGQVLFGTGAPDTTGYAYGVYGMLSPLLGDRLLLTPDFTRAVLEGDLYIAGHITVFTVLWNVLKVLLDKKLRGFVKKMKAGRKK